MDGVFCLLVYLLLMANEFDISQLTRSDLEDYWYQFLRFYAKETGKNFSSKVPISYLEKVLKDEIAKKYDLEDSRYTLNSPSSLAKQLINRGAIEFETFRPEQKFTEKYEKALSKIISKININPKYTVEILEERPNEVRLDIGIDIEDWLKLSTKDKIQANNFDGTLRTNILKLLGVEFGSPAHGKLSLNNYGVSIKGTDKWIKNVMDKKIKKEIKNSIFGKYIQRMSIKIDRDKLRISIVQPRWGGLGYGENRNSFEKFVDDLFEKYGYNKESIDLRFV
jgi:hypothetical protein